MDVQINDESAVLAICDNLSRYVVTLEGNIVNLSSIIQKVKSGWQSTGIDKESYILELEKQCGNLRLLSELTRKLYRLIYDYIINSVKISSLSVGDAVGVDLSTGYGSAGNAVNDVGAVKLSSYVDENSSIRGFAVVNENGTVTDMSYDPGMTIEEFAKMNNVGIDRVAVDIGKDGVGQAWVPASTFE